MKSETKELARALAIELAAIADVPKCEWITEEKTLEEFPFGKETLKQMRLSQTLEYRHHWKYTKSPNNQTGRKGAIIYHRQRMIKYVDSI